jgi:hypothetical protein
MFHRIFCLISHTSNSVHFECITHEDECNILHSINIKLAVVMVNQSDFIMHDSRESNMHEYGYL